MKKKVGSSALAMLAAYLACAAAGFLIAYALLRLFGIA
jgi:hypothetical protein